MGSSPPYSKFHLVGSFLEHSKGMMVIMGLVRSLFEYRLNIFSGWDLWGQLEIEEQALGSRWSFFGPSANERLRSSIWCGVLATVDVVMAPKFVQRLFVSYAYVAF